MLKFTVIIVILAAIVAPGYLVYAQGDGNKADAGLIICGKATNQYEPGRAYTVVNECTFGELILVMNKVIEFILFKLLMPLAVITIAWAGLQMVIFSTNPSKVTAAKKLLWDVLFGIVLALGAYLIILTIVRTFVSDNTTGSQIKQFLETNQQ